MHYSPRLVGKTAAFWASVQRAVELHESIGIACVDSTAAKARLSEARSRWPEYVWSLVARPRLRAHMIHGRPRET